MSWLQRQADNKDSEFEGSIPLVQKVIEVGYGSQLGPATRHDEKSSVPEIMEFSPREYSDTLSVNKETEKEVETDNDKNTSEYVNCNNFDICSSAAVDSSMEYGKKESDECFDQNEIIQVNASSILGDVRSMPDMHSDEVKMNVEEDVFDVHSEDEREDCPISNAESRSEFRKNSLGSVSSDDVNEHDSVENKPLDIDSDSMIKRSEEENKRDQYEDLCDAESSQSKEKKNIGIFPVK